MTAYTARTTPGAPLHLTRSTTHELGIVTVDHRTFCGVLTANPAPLDVDTVRVSELCPRCRPYVGEVTP